MVFKENTKAIYLQIADKICDEVMVGSIRQGDRIPSVREYASTLQVNANTVMRSYDYLDKAGVIFNRRGIGFFFSEDAWKRIMAMRREAFYCGEMQDFFHKINLLGITPEELTKLYTNYLDTKK